MHHAYHALNKHAMKSEKMTLNEKELIKEDPHSYHIAGMHAKETGKILGHKYHE